MLDLNLDVISSPSCPWMTSPSSLLKLPEENSGTSNSSVVNAEEANEADDDDESSLLAFDFMKKREKEEEAGGEIVTRQFFPVVAGGWADYREGFGKEPQWLYLSFGESGGELGILQQPKQEQISPPHQPMRKSRRGPRSRSSQYRGVTFYRRTGRWESHIWDCGKQVYLGGFDTAYAAARVYDRVAIRFRGVDADINFNVSDYEEDMKQMSNLTKEEFVHVLRRQSTRFSREASKYRGMTLQKCSRWDPRMGQFSGNKPYDKAVVPKPEPGLYEGQIMFNAGGKGSSGQNLDLSLGMRPTPFCSNVVENKREHSQWIDPALRQDFPTVGCSSSVPKGGGITNFALPSKRPLWTAVYPTVSPNYEVAVSEKRVKGISTSSSSSLPRHANNAEIGAPAPYAVPMFASNNLNIAASSGFSSPTTAPPPPYLATVSASSIPMNKNGFTVPAAGGYYTYRG